MQQDCSEPSHLDCSNHDDASHAPISLIPQEGCLFRSSKYIHKTASSCREPSLNNSNHAGDRILPSETFSTCMVLLTISRHANLLKSAQIAIQLQSPNKSGWKGDKTMRTNIFFLSLFTLAVFGCNRDSSTDTPVSSDSDIENDYEYDETSGLTEASGERIPDNEIGSLIFGFQSGCPLYDAGNDPDGRITLGGVNTLTIETAIIRDNGEGDGGAHGPYGNLHVLLLDGTTPDPTYGDIKCATTIAAWSDGHLLGEMTLRGETWTGEMYEWEDNQCRNYKNVGLYRYSSTTSRPSLKILVYESDGPGDWEWLVGDCPPGRAHDPLIWGIISGNILEAGAYIRLDSQFECAADVVAKFPQLEGAPKMTIFLRVGEDPPPPPPPAKLAHFSNLEAWVDHPSESVGLFTGLQTEGYKYETKVVGGYWVQQCGESYCYVSASCNSNTPEDYLGLLWDVTSEYDTTIFNNLGFWTPYDCFPDRSDGATYYGYFRLYDTDNASNIQDPNYQSLTAIGPPNVLVGIVWNGSGAPRKMWTEAIVTGPDRDFGIPISSARAEVPPTLTGLRAGRVIQTQGSSTPPR